MPSYLNSSIGSSRSASLGSLSNPACSKVFGGKVTSLPSLSTVVTLPAKELEKQVHNKIRHTSCEQNIMYEKWGGSIVILFDIKMIVKSNAIEIFKLPQPFLRVTS